MRQTKTVTYRSEDDPSKTQHVVEVLDVVCNLCGESCRHPRVPHNVNGLIDAQETGGYGQAIPPDLERWTFDLCQYCLGWLVSKLKIPPTREEQLLGSGIYVPAETEGRTLHALMTGDLAELSEWEQKDVATALLRHPPEVQAK